MMVLVVVPIHPPSTTHTHKSISSTTQQQHHHNTTPPHNTPPPHNTTNPPRARREVAAKAGIIPVLVHLAAPPGIPDYDPAGGADSNTDAVQPVQEELRQLAVPLLCLMTQPGNIEKTRGMLKQAGALGVLLDLLQEEVCLCGGGGDEC